MKPAAGAVSSDRPFSSRPALTALAVAVLSALPFLPALRAGFVNWDDGVFLIRNMVVQRLSWRGLLPLFTRLDGGYFQPVADLSMALQYRLWGHHPAGYHAFNVAIHAINAALVWLIARRLLSGGAPRVAAADEAGALACALFFGIHPLRVESVAWISEWRDVQCGFFFLSAIYGHLRMAAAPADRRSSWRGLIAASTLLCVLTKLMGITLPFVLLLLDLYPLKRWKEPVLREKWALFVVAGAQALIGWLGAVVTGSITPLGWEAKLSQIAYGLGFYVWKTALPFGLSPIYEASWLLNPAPFLFYGAAGIACLGACWAVRRRCPAAATAAAYYILTSLPVIGLIRSGRQIVADRFSYLPCLGWALLLGAAVSLTWGRRRAGAALLAVLLGLGVATWRQCGVWRDPIALWSRVIDVEPEDYFARYRLADALKDIGLRKEAEAQRQLAYRVETAIFERAYELNTRRGEPARAAECLKKLEELRTHPDYSL